MKDKLNGRNLDHQYCISRMDYFEGKCYDFIYNKDDICGGMQNIKMYAPKGFTDFCITTDKFIESMINCDMIIREHLYYPKI